MDKAVPETPTPVHLFVPKRFIAWWNHTYMEPGARVVTMDAFIPAAGYSEQDQAAIAALEQGQVWARSSSHTVTRIPDETAALLDGNYALSLENAEVKENFAQLADYAKDLRQVISDIKDGKVTTPDELVAMQERIITLLAEGNQLDGEPAAETAETSA